MLYAFAAWTLFVWSTRIRNIVDDGTATGAAKALDLSVAAGLVVLGVLVLLAARRGRPAWAVPVLAVATVAVWAVRIPLMLLDDRWTVGFEVVHTALAVASVALAWGAWRSWQGRRREGVEAAAGVPAGSG